MEEDLAPIGMLATVRDLLRTSPLGVQMLIELHERVRIETISENDPYLKGTFSELTETSDGAPEELMAESIAYLEQYAEIIGEVNRQVLATMRNQESAGELADFLAGLLNLPFDLE